MDKEQDKKYLDILVKSIRVCEHYKPKFGQGAKEPSSKETAASLRAR